MLRWIACRLTAWALIVLSCGHAAAQLPVISLRALSQSFFAPGGTYQVHIADGSHLDEISQLVFSHPGIRSTLLSGPSDALTGEAVPRYGHFDVQIPADLPEGRYEARAVGRFGISNPRSIVIRNHVRWNTSAAGDQSAAVTIEPDVMFCRQTSSQQRDHFELSVDGGQAYQLWVVAQAVDSPLIAVLTVIGPDGRTLYRTIGNEQVDASLSFVAQESSTLTVVVNDALFRGGAQFQYGLIAGVGSVDRIAELQTLPPKSISVVASDGTPSVATESPMSLVVPAMVTGQFDSIGDRDLYLCDFSKDQPVQIEVVSDRIGQPTDARLIVERQISDAAGAITWQQVATGEDSQEISDSVVSLSSGDPILRFQPPEDGRYRVSVIDLDTGRALRETQEYQLLIQSPRTDWHLLAYNLYPNRDPNASTPVGSHLMRGGSTVIRVFVIRDGMSSPIEVSVVGLADGLSCRPARIAANQNQTDLVITASEHANVHQGVLQIVGTVVQDVGQDSATPGGIQDAAILSRPAQAACLVWQRDGSRPAHRVRLMDEIIIRSTDLDVEPVSIRPASDAVVSTGKGSTVKIPIQVTRRDGGGESIVLRPQNLPPGIKVGELTIDKDKTEAEWNVEVTEAAQPGVYSFWGQGETKVKFSLNPQSLAFATARRDKLAALRADPERAAQSAELDAAITAADKEIETRKNQSASKDLTVYLATPLITLDIQ